MTSSEIIECNKLIAEFDKLPFKTYGTTGKTYYIGDNPITVSNLRYHSDWNWLMPVVEKIEKLGYFTKIYSYTTGNEIEHYMDVMSYSKDDQYKSLYLFGKFTYDKSKLIATWSSIIQFIKWYNKTIQNEENSDLWITP